MRLFQFRFLVNYSLDALYFLQAQVVLELLHVDPDSVQLDLQSSAVFLENLNVLFLILFQQCRPQCLNRLFHVLK